MAADGPICNRRLSEITRPHGTIYLRRLQMETLTLHKTKDTKNKVVYGTKDGSVIQSVYIDKDALGDVPPAEIQVVISQQ